MAEGLPNADDVFGTGPATGLPSADDAFGPAHPVRSGPAEDSWFSHVGNGASEVLNSIGQGASSGWGTTPHVLNPETEKWLQKAGTFNDYKDGRTSVIKSANEALMRPAAAALDVVLHPVAAGWAAMVGIAAGTQQVGTELQRVAKHLPPGAATVVGGTGEIIQSFPEGFGVEFPLRPFTPADFAKAKNLKVIGGGEGGYFGTKTATPAEGLQAAIKQIREEEGQLDPSTGEPVTPEEKARAAGGSPPQPAVPDVNAIAREIAPDTFKAYDALAAEREAYRHQIAELSASREETPEAKAAQEKVDTILGKVNGVEDRLTKAAGARLDAAREELDDALHRDTPEMQGVRQQLLATDFQMRNMATQVAQAYREAQARVPQVEEAPTAAPVEPPQPEQPPQQIVPAHAAGLPEVEPPSVTGAEKLGTVKPPINVASDVAEKLVAAGRPQEEADAAAAIVQAHYEARAARFGGKKGTAAEMYARDAPEIRGAGIRKRALEMAQGRTLHQPAVPPYDEIQNLRDAVQQKHGLQDLSLWVRPNGDLVVNSIIVPRDVQGRGHGSAAMQDIVQYADAHDLRIVLSPAVRDDRMGTTSRSRLVKFYKRFGFVENTGRNKDFALSEGMYREPKRTLYQDDFKTEPGATDAQGNALPQTIIPGAEASARQLAAAREAQGKGLKFTRKGQKEAGGLFEGEKPEDEQGTLFQGGVETPEFRKWFGNSQVVDEAGEPLVVYHGSNKRFNEFKPTPSKRSDEGRPVDVVSPTFFFSPDRNTARMFARDRGEIAVRLRGEERGRPESRPFYLSAKQPLDFGDGTFGPDVDAAEEMGRITGYEPQTWEDVQRLLDDPDVVKRLREWGYDGVRLHESDGAEAWGVFSPEQIKSIYNRGAFSPDSANVYLQSRRGSITLGESRNVIKLFKDADASTFMHETAHHWLEELRADAADPEAPADLVKDSQTVHGWLGAKEGEKLTRAQHEKFARGFERYLMEGVAPSRALANVFAKFREWLTKIYQTATRLRSPINDDIRGVFDRLITAKPEHTVIAPERPIEAHLADIHEAEAEHTPPERAAPVADHIRSEVNSVTKEKAPDVHAGLPANEAGGIESPDAPFPGGADAARSAAGAEGNPEASRTQPESRDETSRKSVGRAEYESALEAVNRVRSRPPKTRDVLDEIRRGGGIKLVNAKGERIAEAGDIEAALKDYEPRRGVKGFTKGDKTRLINNETGASPDYIRESLAEDGWFGSNREEATHNTDINDFIDLIRRAAQEGDAFHPEDEAVYEIEARRVVDEEMGRTGISHSDSNEYAAHKLATWRASQEAAQFAGEQEERAYEELARLEPADMEELQSHGYEPGADIGAEHGPAGPEHIGDSGQLGEREAFEPQVLGTGTRPAATGAGHPGTEVPAGPNERFSEPESDGLIDKAGNIVLDNLNTTEDVKSVLRHVAEENDQFLSARRGVVSDQDILSYADAMGIEAREVNLQHLRAISLEDGIPLAARIHVGREMLIQSAKAVHDAADAGDELSFATASQRHLMIHETLSAVTAEMGRGLRAFRAMGDEATKAQNLSEFLQQNTGRTLFQLRDEMKRIKRLDTPAKVSGFLREARKPSLGDMGLEIFKNWLISGPITHMTYSVGNSALALWKAIPETAMEATIATLRGTEGADRARFGEVPAQVYAIIRGQRNGFQAGYDALKSGQTMALPGEGDELPLFPGKVTTPFTNTKAVPNFKVGPVPIPLGSIVRAPGERMVAPIHSYFRNIGYAQSIARQAYRMASNENLIGNTFSRRVAELTVRPTKEMMETARREATEQTLMGRGGELTKRVSALMNWEPVAPIIGHVKPLAFIDPFVHIASNIVEQAVIERSPLALASHQLRDDILGHNGEAAQNSAIARSLTGSALGLVGMGLAAEGLLTPSAPSDLRQADLWRRTHGMPHSVTIGDYSVDLSRLGVLGFQLGIAADLQHAYRVATSPDADFNKVAALLIHSFTQNFLDEGFMRGPSDLIKALDDNERYGASWWRNFVSSAAVPYSVGMAQLAKQVDPYAREARTTLEAMKAKLPWVSESLEPRIDVWGRPIQNREWTGTYTQPISRDPVDLACEEAGVYPSKVQRHIRGVELTEQQYTRYAVTAGTTAKMQLDAMVRMPGFGSLPVSVRQDMIKEAIKSSRETARALVMTEYSEIMKQATEAKAAALH